MVVDMWTWAVWFSFEVHRHQRGSLWIPSTTTWTLAGKCWTAVTCCDCQYWVSDGLRFFIKIVKDIVNAESQGVVLWLLRGPGKCHFVSFQVYEYESVWVCCYGAYGGRRRLQYNRTVVDVVPWLSIVGSDCYSGCAEKVLRYVKDSHFFLASDTCQSILFRIKMDKKLKICLRLARTWVGLLGEPRHLRLSKGMSYWRNSSDDATPTNLNFSTRLFGGFRWLPQVPPSINQRMDRNRNKQK